MRWLAFVTLAGCLHSPPYAGDDGGVVDAGIIDIDANDGCPGGQSFGHFAGLTSLAPPACANTMTVDAYGAGGGAAGVAQGGKGGRVKVTFPIASGLMWFVVVGRVGGTVLGTNRPGFGGDNGGGAGGHTSSAAGGGGGGATDVRTSTALTDRIVIAGAGGGATICANKADVVGGDGGGTVGGEPGTCTNAAALPVPGGQTLDGSALCNAQSAGALGQGGQGCSSGAGGGGGGGYYGGGGGLNTGGAGGSSYLDPTLTPTLNNSGENSGNGHVEITWDHVP
jgi:hypothetical protein